MNPQLNASFNIIRRFGYGDLWLLQLSGLAQKNTSIAWQEILYDPVIQGDLTSASTSYVTPAGPALASWSLDGKDLAYTVTVPVGSTGWVYMNGTGVKEGGRVPQKGKNGVVSVKRGCERTLIEVGSGNYEFTAMMR